MTRRFLFLVLAASLSGLVSEGNAADINPCEFDIPKFCGGETPGEGRVHACMMTQQDGLSRECRNTVIKVDGLVEKLLVSCREDAHRYCEQYMNRGTREIYDCLKSKKDQVTEACKRVHRQIKATRYDPSR